MTAPSPAGGCSSGGAAAGAGACSAACPAAAARQHRGGAAGATVDVVVVGAGFAGLTAARRARPGRPLGGRARGARPRRRAGRQHELGGGEITERGGTFIGPTQDHIIALAKAMGVGHVPDLRHGRQRLHRRRASALDLQRHRADRDGAARPADPRPTSPWSSPSSTRCRPRSRSTRRGRPPNAAEWDAQTLEHAGSTSNSVTPQFQRARRRLATRPIFGAEPRELSLLFVLFYIAASGNEQNPGTFERNFNTRGGAQMCRFDGGSQRDRACGSRRSSGARVVLELAGAPDRRSATAA